MTFFGVHVHLVANRSTVSQPHQRPHSFALRMSMLAMLGKGFHTPFHSVLARAETDIVFLPLDHLIDMDELNNDNLCSLHRASRSGRYGVVRFLFSARKLAWRKSRHLYQVQVDFGAPGIMQVITYGAARLLTRPS
jgi:hypothetical protein